MERIPEPCIVCGQDPHPNGWYESYDCDIVLDTVRSMEVRGRVWFCAEHKGKAVSESQRDGTMNITLPPGRRVYATI